MPKTKTFSEQLAAKAKAKLAADAAAAGAKAKADADKKARDEICSYQSGETYAPKTWAKIEAAAEEGKFNLDEAFGNPEGKFTEGWKDAISKLLKKNKMKFAFYKRRTKDYDRDWEGGCKDTFDWRCTLHVRVWWGDKDPGPIADER